MRSAEAMPELRDPWAVLDVPQGSPVERGETTDATAVRSERGEQQPEKEARVQKAGKLTGWSSAEQVVTALAAVGMEAVITKREDIRVRIEQVTHCKGVKPQFVVYQYPTTRAVLAQGKLGDTVRARLAEWQAGQGQERSARWVPEMDLH